jgi:hypothetical protein
MKHLKMLVLAPVAALGLMALAGAGTASATTLFTDSAHTIDYPVGTTLHFTQVPGTTTVETGTEGSTLSTCTNSTIHATTLNTTGTWIVANIDAFTWENCNQTTDTVTGGKLEIMWTAGTSGEVVGVNTSWTTAIFGVSCTYGFGAGTKLGTIVSGSAPVLKINATIPKVAGGFLCPSTEVIHGEYFLTTPHAMYITD